MNLWKEIQIGRRPPEEVSVVVESPKGSRNKYKYNPEWNAIHLERVFLAPLRCPGEYGFIPQTYCSDKGPLEAIVVIDEPTYAGCIIDARPVGLLNMLESGAADDKVLCVLINDPKYADYRELSDVETHILEGVAHFFEVYKRLEGKETTVVGWDEADVAKERIQYAMDLFERMTDV
jgi:inorganic pyrophosphatase